MQLQQIEKCEESAQKCTAAWHRRWKLNKYNDFTQRKVESSLNKDNNRNVKKRMPALANCILYWLIENHCAP
jgi:hypothetical protein